ncbi:hypothetical protein S245_056253, partial [Arachis hypogaea]
QRLQPSPFTSCHSPSSHRGISVRTHCNLFASPTSPSHVAHLVARLFGHLAITHLN